MPAGAVPAPAGAVPDAAGAPVADGMGNGGATVADAVTVLGTLETATEAVVSVAAGGGALVSEVPKSSGSVTPLSMAQVLASTPSGQQKPLIKQNEPDGQGSESKILVYHLWGLSWTSESKISLTAFRAARVTDALIVAHVAVGAQLGVASEGLFAGCALAGAGAGRERLILSRHELAGEHMSPVLGGHNTACEGSGEHQCGEGGGEHFGY